MDSRKGLEFIRLLGGAIVFTPGPGFQPMTLQVAQKCDLQKRHARTAVTFQHLGPRVISMSAYELPSIAANLFNHEIPQFFIFELEEYEDVRSLYVEINRYKELCCHELIVNVNKNC